MGHENLEVSKAVWTFELRWFGRLDDRGYRGVTDADQSTGQ